MLWGAAPPRVHVEVAFLLVAHSDLLLGSWRFFGHLGLSHSFGLVGLHFLAFGFHFLAFWPFGPSFPCILALWAFISLHFGILGLHFLAFWLCGPSFPCILAFWWSASGGPPHMLPEMARLPNVLTGSILQFLAFWAFISLHFGRVGLHFLAFWPCGPSCPCILAFGAFVSLHFGLVGLHFLAFWPCGPSFPCILALWAFISLHFGLVGLHFLAFWPFRGQLPGAFPTCCRKWPVCPTSLQWICQRRDRLHFAVSSLLGLHFLAFWPCGPSFPFISGQALALCKRPLPEIGFFACAPARIGFLPVKPLPSANDPYLK